MSRQAAAVAAAALAIAAQCAVAADRLLPSAEAAKVGIAFQKDGKALTVQLTNASALVVTGGEIRCMVHQPVTSPAPSPPPATAGPSGQAPEPLKLTREDFEAAGVPYPGDKPRGGKGSRRPVYRDPSVGVEVKDAEFVTIALPADTRILPGKGAEAYAESPKAIESCTASDLRGREKKALELF